MILVCFPFQIEPSPNGPHLEYWTFDCDDLELSWCKKKKISESIGWSREIVWVNVDTGLPNWTNWMESSITPVMLLNKVENSKGSCWKKVGYMFCTNPSSPTAPLLKRLNSSSFPPENTNIPIVSTVPKCQLCPVSYAWCLMRCNMDRPDNVLHLASCKLNLGFNSFNGVYQMYQDVVVFYDLLKSLTSCFLIIKYFPWHHRLNNLKFTSFSDSAIAPMVSFTTLGGQNEMSKKL